MTNSIINVLQVEVGTPFFTGVSSYLYQQYRAIEKEKVHYDFLYLRNSPIPLMRDDPAFAGSVFFSLDARHGSSQRLDYLKVIREIKRILKENLYNIIVINSSNIEVAAACFLAVMGKKDIRFIAHAHNTKLESGSLRQRHTLLARIADSFCRHLVRTHASYLFGCTKAAGRSTFGPKAVEQENFMVIRDAICLEQYLPDPAVRHRIRALSGLNEHTLVFGWAGRLVPSKNLSFLLRIFSELHALEADSLLWLAGDGPERESLMKQARDLRLEQHIVFWGERSDVADLMQGMDAFIFPSLSEGLGMVVIEAQSSGLPTIISDGVPDDAMITDRVRKVSLSATPEEWAEAVMDHLHSHPGRVADAEQLSLCGYNVHEEAKKVSAFYLEICAGNKCIRDTAGPI